MAGEHYRWLFVAVLSISCLSGPVSAVPLEGENPGSLGSRTNSSLSSDPALAVRVGLEVERQPLEEVLKQLSERARREEKLGIRLTTVRHLRDLRMNLRIREKPLQEVLDRMASLWSLPRYPARWIKRGAGYELWQDPKAAQEGLQSEMADRQLLADHLRALMDRPYRPEPIDSAAVERERQRLGGVAASYHPRQLVPPEFLPMDPRIGQWSKHWGAAVGAFLRALTPLQREQVLNGAELYLPVSAFAPEMQELFFVAAATTREGKPIPGTQQIEWETLEARQQRFQHELVGFHIERNREEGVWFVSLGLRNAAGRGTGGTGYRMPMGLGETILAEKGTLPAVRPQPVPFPDGNQDERETPLSDDRKKQWLVAVEQLDTLVAVQDLLARELGVSILSDHYARNSSYFHSRFEKAFRHALASARTVEGFLDALCRDLEYCWKREGNTLLFRSRIWWIEDQTEVPPELARRLERAHRERGYLDLDDLTSAAELRKEQLATLGADYLPGSTACLIETLQPWLRLYASLEAAGRRQLAGERGMALNELPPHAQLLLRGDPRFARELEQQSPEVLVDTPIRLFQRREGETAKSERVLTLLQRRTPDGAWRGVALPQVPHAPVGEVRRNLPRRTLPGHP